MELKKAAAIAGVATLGYLGYALVTAPTPKISRAESLKKDSCCCGATKSKPCTCMVEGKSCSGTCACASDKKAEGGYDWPMNYPSRASQSKRTPSREAGYDYCLICGDNGDDGKQMTEGFRPQSSMCDLHGCTCEDCFCHDCLREKTSSTNRNVIHKPCACASDKKAETFMPPVHKDECTVCVGFADLKDLGPDYEVFLLCEDCITKAKTMPRHYSAESWRDACPACGEGKRGKLPMTWESQDRKELWVN